MTGGIFQGWAFGNNFNFTDAPDLKYEDRPVMGKVLVYTTHAVKLSNTAPYMSLKHAVVHHLAPILEKLGQHFPLLLSKLFYQPFYK